MDRRVAQRSLRIAISLTIVVALLPLPGIASFVSEGAQAQSDTRSPKVKPKPGKPEGSFPNLDDVKNESELQREAQPPIPSTVRSPKGSEKSWDGRRVGDPESPRGQSDNASANDKQTRRAHARRRLNPAPFTIYEDQFIQNFFSYGVARSATYDETLFWNYQLRAAYNQGQASLKLAAVELGKTLFESANYAARNRDNHWYVYDLYRTFLMREPDSSGWSFWESQVPLNGRENVRRAFEEAPEFWTLLGTIILSGPANSSAASLISARVEPRNQPSNGMLARDLSWSVPLLSLPGRNGLDLGLSLSYSSNVWTPSGPYFHFDEDNGFPSPGFRLGFPAVQRKVFNAQTGKNAFLLIMPAGRRIDLRQVGTSNIYEAGDSSYLQLTDNSPNLLVRTTDGTQLSFVEINNEFQCTQVKDRNGNYIVVNRNGLGRITTITDTLGRVITFNYDTYANLISITQAWSGQPSHQWVSFGWSTRNMQYSFATDKVIGTGSGTTWPVITQVTLNDTSHYTFDYTNSLQVSSIKNYFGALERHATTVTYETPSGDVPRVSSSSVSAHNWTGLNGVPAQVTTNYIAATDGSWCQMTAPDGTIYKEFYGTGWQRGLTTLSEVWSGGVKQKWTTTAWTQDNTSVNYETNPRVTEKNIYDAGGNRRRTTIEYGPYAQWGLPYGVREYAANGTTEIRQTFTDYNLAQEYLDRRIIGLVSHIHVSNVAQWQSKTTFTYDDPARLHGVPAAATQHDVNYNLSFTARGNVTAVSRWDITDINNAAKALTTYTNYYNTGTPILTTDPAGHQNSTTYADSFSDSVNRNTFAYPTSMTNADGFSSSVQYNYDFGARTRTQAPAPSGQPQGGIQTMTYNSLGLLERITTTNNGAYKRFWYGAEFTASYATVNNAADESYSIDVTDGLGRVIGSATNHPGSAGGYSLKVTVYNLMGLAQSWSNPTEVNSSWVPSGDDAAGMYSTQQTYDWQGRPLVTTHPDLTTKEASYAGCGCAGGDVVTLTDEGTIDGGVAKRRQQKIYSDVFGRTVKTEILNWQGGSVYSAAVTTYNVRDQVEQIRRYAGAEGSGSYQDTTMTYDGYGRLKTKHLPEHNTGTFTTWNYNADDTVQSVVDARGASSTYTYNNRHLVTAIAYSGGNGTTPNVSFTYDAAGNKTYMTDGIGNVTYAYDQLSRLTQETRFFTDLNQSYAITSGYNLANQLTSVGTPFTSQQVNYAYDTAGRIDAVTGSGYYDTTYQGYWPNWYPLTRQVNTFVSNISQRAAGGVKQLTYGNGGQLSFSYNPRLAPTSYQLSNFAGQQSFTATYTYYNDGRLKFATDPTNSIFDRFYSYDHVARYKEALSGDEARGGTATDGPYRQSFTYDVWGNTTSLYRRVWTLPPQTINATYTNNRRAVWGYDANGYAGSHEDGDTWYTSGYDAISRRNYFEPIIGYAGGLPMLESHYYFDGNSLPTKTTGIQRTEDPETFQVTTTTSTGYYLHSTALGGQVIADLDQQGTKTAGYIYLNGMMIAHEMFIGWPNAHWLIQWQHQDPVTASTMISNLDGGIWGGGQIGPLGESVGSPPPEEVYIEPPYASAKNQEFWPIEAAGWDAGRTNEMEIGMAQYIDTRDMIMAREAWRRGDRDRAQRIVAANPNVGIVASGPGAIYLAQQADFEENADGSFTFWGANAARALGLVTARDTVERPRAPQAANASPEEQARFEAAFDDSTARLRDKKCASALGGYRRAFRALRETIWSFVDFDRGQRGAGNRWEEGAGARTVGRNVDINPYGAFMMNELAQIGGHKFMGGAFAIRVNVIPVRAPTGGYAFYQVQGSLNMGSFIFLHELGHRAGVFVADSVVTSGGAGPGLSMELQGDNNGKIFEACGFKSQSVKY